jgi:hypothetical protein
MKVVITKLDRGYTVESPNGATSGTTVKASLELDETLKLAREELDITDLGRAYRDGMKHFAGDKTAQAIRSLMDSVGCKGPGTVQVTVSRKAWSDLVDVDDALVDND